MNSLLKLSDFETAAARTLDPLHFDYFAGAAGDLITLRANETAYDKLSIHYQVLRDVSHCDTSCNICGLSLPHPIIAAPTAFHCLANPEGEVATSRGLAQSGALMTLSSLSTRLLEDVASASDGPKWFQLYVNRDRSFTTDLIARAEAASYRALVVTADAPRWGNRYKDIRNGFHLPSGLNAVNLVPSNAQAQTLSHSGSGMGAALGWMLDPSLTWRDIEWLCGTTTLSILVKGICRPDDALSAFAHGAAGVIVSNHGGRQLDSAPATLSVLPSIRAAVGNERLLIVDGGIRRGTDVLKAIALGANAIQIGRPVIWGLAAGGAAGVSRTITLLREELELAMALSGIASLREIPADLVR